MTETADRAAPSALTNGLSEIAGVFDALLVDVWGVLHNGREVFGPALEACRRFRAERGPVALISNAPVPAEQVESVFDRLGAPRDFYDGVVTSGDATRSELARRAPGPAFKLGPDWDDRLYAGLRLNFAPLEEAAFISCTGLFDAANETASDYAELLETARARDLEMVCANPDIVVRVGDRLVPCSGALAEAYAALGGRVIYSGKPHPPIYRLGYAVLDAVARRPIERGRVLAIGDGPKTDIAGAMSEGVAALFIAAGVNDADALRADPEAAARLLGQAGLRADYVAPELRWD